MPRRDLLALLPPDKAHLTIASFVWCIKGAKETAVMYVVPTQWKYMILLIVV